MKLFKLNRTQQKGFTIIELMIATSVFSVVLLLCTYGLLEIGRTYYKGVTITRTQETARRIVDDVSEAIKFSADEVAGSESGGRGHYCVGSKRYSFVLNRQLDDSSPSHALVSDKPTSCGYIDIDTSFPSGGEEMLSTRMRLSKFSIERVGSTDLYTVRVLVATGDDDVFVDHSVADLQCSGERSSSQFCAVTELTTTVQKRL